MAGVAMYHAAANFALVMWSAVLLIEAKTIQINERIFNVAAKKD